jgi:hypothetical protein
MEQQSFLNIAKERRNLVIALAISIFAIDGLVFFTAGSELEIIVGDLSRIGTISAAAILSLVVVARQKTSGLFGRAYTSLAIGLILWVAAESLWGYYEIGLAIERPFPSLADALWIAGYGPFAYHLFSTARFFGKGVKKSTIVIVGVAAALFLAFYVQAIAGVFALEGPEALPSLAISISYPVLDVLLVVPAVLIITNAGRGQLTSIPWIFVGWILLVLADSLLGIAAVSMPETVFHITMLYNAAYLCMMAGLIWYNRQFLLDLKQTVK